MACKDDVLIAVDVLTKEDIQTNPVPGTTKLDDLGIGPRKCLSLDIWVSKRRVRAGKKAVKRGTVKPSTTIDALVTLACP